MSDDKDPKDPNELKPEEMGEPQMSGRTDHPSRPITTADDAEGGQTQGSGGNPPENPPPTDPPIGG